jgi:phage/plasmid-like protein (TIGR03299 family)
MSIDVNTQFHETRMNQIEQARTAGERAAQSNADRVADFDRRMKEGKLLNLGNGQFKVTEPGWDNGEILRLRLVDVEGVAQRQILPVHGLDETTGAAALYTRVPAWHELGQVIPAGVSSIDEVMELARIKFMVGKTPVRYHNLVTGELETLDGKFVTTRDDTGKGLGVVGDSYEVFQNHEAFEFLEALVDRFGVTWESAGALRNGARVFVSMRLPHDIRIDPGGVNDEIVPFVVLTTTHDGSGKVEAMVTPWRPICGNTERLAVKNAFVKWGTRHTKNIKDKVAEARRTFAQSVAYFEKFVVEEEALARTEMTIKDVLGVIDEVWGELDKDAKPQAKTMRNKLTETILETWQENVEVLGRTGYAAERTFTQYADWKRGLKPRSLELRGNDLATRATAMLDDTAGDLKSNIHRRLMLRVGGGTERG